MVNNDKLYYILKDIRCALVNAPDTSVDIGPLELLLEQILQAISDQPQIEGLTPIRYCDEDGVTGFVAYYMDEETSAISELFLDSNGQPTTTRPTGTICPPEDDYEYKDYPVEKCLEDGTRVLEVVCIPIINGEQQDEIVFWIQDSVVLDTEPVGLGECTTCEPKVTEVFSTDVTTLEGGNVFLVEKPNCCTVELVTSAGTITLTNNTMSLTTPDFGCNIEIESITTDCDESKIHIVSFQTK